MKANVPVPQVVALLCCLFGTLGNTLYAETTTSLTAMVPRGYQQTVEIQVADQVLSFGPFVGYYFKPTQVPDTSRLEFLCFNERGFYTKDKPANTLLYSGSAVFQVLESSLQPIPMTGQRIVPLFFADAPEPWKQARPEPQEMFIHFHSAHNAQGAVYAGFWLAHQAEATFTYDMGGRIGPQSPLYHTVKAGPDRDFARIIEFDHGA
nr:hypothetical protein [uncultured Desulfobulbus sp.]